jgi:uncharacterized protein (UPF0261 family)
MKEKDKKTVAILGCLDTKFNEIMYAKSIVENNGGKALIIDVSVRELLELKSDVTPKKLLSYIDLTWKEILTMSKVDRINAMSEALKVAIKELYRDELFDGIYAMGGAQNSLMASSAMIQLPYGVPKLLLSTMASGKRIFAPYIDTKDIVVMHSVADISGLNTITKSVIGNAVGAIMGMVKYGVNSIGKSDKKIIGTTMLGITSKGVEKTKQLVEEFGYETITFHANGVGGKAMEELIYSGMINATMDLTLHEMVNELLGGYCTGANNRLVAAGKMGIPQIIAPGAIDMIDFATDESGNSYPIDWKDRQKIFHNKNIIHMKVTKDEIIQLGTIVAKRINKSKGKVTVILPNKGFCEAGSVGNEFFNKEIDTAFITTLKEALNENIKVIDYNGCINDEEFAMVTYKELLNIMKD